MSTEVEIHTKNLDLTDRLREYVEKKVPKLTRYIQGIDSTRVDLTHAKSARNAQDRYVAQITVRGNRFILRAEERADDIMTALDAALANMQRRIARFKGRRYRGRGDGTPVSQAFAPEVQEEEPTEPVIVRRKRFLLTPMSEEEAIEQMELLGHNFFVFFNASTGQVNVLYQRHDGTYGLIEPEIG